MFTATVSRLRSFWHRHTAAQALYESSLYIAASVGINLITFTYNLYLGRRLEVADFGLVVVIANILAVLQIPLSSYTRAITHTVAYSWGKGDASIQQIWQYFRRTSYIASALLTIVWLAAIWPMMLFFKISSPLPLFLVAPLWFVSVTAAVDSGVLLGLHKFKKLGFTILTEALLFFLVTVVLVETNLADYLYIATPISALVSFAITWIAVRQSLHEITDVAEKTAATFPWKFYVHSVAIKFSAVAFITFDVLLAKHFLSAQQAGEYVLLTVVGKMIYYASALLGQFVVPLVSKELGAGRNPRLVFLALFLSTLAILMGSYIGVGLLGWITVPILLGAKAQAIVPYLPWYVFGMACFGLSSLIISYYQSKENSVATVISLIATGAVLIGITIFHESVWEISWVMAVAGMLSLMLAILYRSSALVLQRGSSAIRNLAVVHSQLPPELFGFRLVEPMTHPRGISTYSLGVYANEAHKVMAKVYSGYQFSAQYKRLLNEARTSKFISAVLAAGTVRSSVHAPAFIQLAQSNRQLTFIQEFIPSNNSRLQFTHSQLHKAILAVIHFLDEVSVQANAQLTAQLMHRSGTRMVLLFPLLLIKAVTAFPSQSPLFLKAAWLFLLRSNQLWGMPATALTHRDIHEGNLLRSGKNVYLIDYGFAVWSIPGYDLVCTTVLHWDEVTLRKMLLRDIKNSTALRAEYTQAIGLYCCLSFLGSSVIPSEVAQQYISALTYWVQGGTV